MEDTFQFLTAENLIDALEFIPDDAPVVINKNGCIIKAFGVGSMEDKNGEKTLVIYAN